MEYIYKQANTIVAKAFKLASRKLGKPTRPLSKFSDHFSMLDERGTPYLVLNLKDGKIPIYGNLDKIWQYQNDFNLAKFMFSIHRSFVFKFASWGKATYDMLNDATMDMAPLSQTLKVTIPVKSGKDYVWVMQSCQALQVDDKNQLYSHINTYQVIRSYNKWENAMPFSEVWINGAKNEKWTQRLHRNIVALSPLETKIAQVCVDADINRAGDIAQALDLNIHQVYNANKGIKNKINHAFCQDFSSAREAAMYVHRMGFLRRSVTN